MFSYHPILQLSRNPLQVGCATSFGFGLSAPDEFFDRETDIARDLSQQRG